MTKTHTEQTGSNLLAHPGRTSDSSPKNTVSKQMSLSDSILFGRHLHTNIEIYRILSGECYMDIQSENLHCTKGDFIMILPDVVHSFYLNDTSDCEFQHIHFNPDMFSTIILDNDGIFCIIFFTFLLSTHL